MDAWQALERLDGWRVEWVRNPRYRGLTHFQRRLIQIDADLTRRAERGVLAHEVVHAQRGSFPRWMRPREEALVRELTARWLIRLSDLGDALAWSLSLHEVAEDLDVEARIVRDRMEHLHPAERAYLLRRTRHHREEAA